MPQKPLLLTDAKHLEIYDQNNTNVGALYGDNGVVKFTPSVIDAGLGTLNIQKIKLCNSVGTPQALIKLAGIGTISFRNADDTDYARILCGRVDASLLYSSGSLIVDGSGTIYSLTVSTDLVVNGDTVIQGNLTVQGTQTILNTQTLEVEDNIILINAGQTGTPTLDGGIEVERGDYTNAVLKWNETNNYWEISEVGDDTNPAVFHRIPWKFLHLEDTPSSYVGQGGKVVAVKTDESGLEFISVSDKVSFTVVDLTSDVPAGTNINIGSYTSGKIMVFVNGVLQTPGTNNDYQETGSTTIAFNYDLPNGARLNIVKF